LFGQCRIAEARNIFNSRAIKSTDVYAERLKRFNMDAGW
jgi:hypothetical protein